MDYNNNYSNIDNDKQNEYEESIHNKEEGEEPIGKKKKKSTSKKRKKEKNQKKN